MRKLICLVLTLASFCANADEVYRDQGTINKVLVSIPVNVEGYKTLKDQVKRFDTPPYGIIVTKVTKENIGNMVEDDQIGDVKYRIFLPVFFPNCAMTGKKMDILKRNGEFLAKDLVANYLLNGVCKRP